MCNINYNKVWSVKYRRKILKPEIEEYLQELVQQIAADKGFTVHLFECCLLYTSGQAILEQGIQIDEILYSPLIRAKETARHVSEVTGIPMREEMRLKEQNFGKYEGTPRNGEEFQKAKANFINSYEGGESMLKLCHRIYDLLDDIKKESDQKTYLLVAHNGISRAIQSYFCDMTNDEFARFGIKNCEIRKFEYKE